MKDYIQQLLNTAVKKIDTANEVPEALLSKIRVDRTKDRAHGDYATNAAMIISKPLHMKPADIAAKLIEAVDHDDRIAKIEIAGPGFINFFVNQGFTADTLANLAKDERLGVARVSVPKTIVVDYSAPNVAKEMAVHHLRSTVIGDAVVRVLEFLGNKVIRANHIGDWGTQFGMLIAYLEKKENESGQGMDLSDFEAFYREAKECYD